MLGKGARERGVFLRSGWTENGLRKLAVTLVATRLDLSVQAAAAALWMDRRGHALCIAGGVPSLKGLRVLAG
jgi:hypothetical protein